MAGETVITVVGNLTSDPELRYTQNGLAVSNFTIASTPRSFDLASNDWKDGDALKFYCVGSPGVDLNLLQSTDIIADTRQALADTNSDGRVIGILNFNCILRTLCWGRGVPC